MSSLSPIVPVQITDFVASNGTRIDPCTASRRYLISAVRSAFKEGCIEDHNCSEHSDEIKEKVLNYSSKQFKVANVKPSNMSYKAVTAKISASVSEKKAMKLGTACGINAEGTELTIFVFQANYPHYGISKGDVFLDARVKTCNKEPENNNDYENVCTFIKIQLTVIVVTSALILLIAYLDIFVESDYQRFQRQTLESFQNMAAKIDLSFLERIKSLESLQNEISKMDFSYFHYIRNLKTMNDVICYLRGNSSEYKK
jgi:hypothetical protein